jgi:polysaccharide export outer membrane protein
MNTRFHSSLLALALTALTAALGQAFPAETRAQPPASQPPRTTPAPYLLGADDVLSIQVINFPELCVPQITVPSDGSITVPVLGSLPVAGQTTAQVARTLTKKWSDYVVSPLVTVTLTQRRHQSVQIYGFVAHAQAVEYRPDLHLLEALAEAGGASETGDMSQVAVTHKNGVIQTADLSDPQTAGSAAQDLALSPDDVIYVPPRHMQISVLGEVAKPGSYAYKDKMTVLDALTDADNVNQATADLSHATLIHDGTEHPLDLNALLVRGQVANNVALAPGDRIYIPELHNRIFVDGAVGHAGYYAFKPGDRLVNAISGSGGTLAGVSDLKKVTVVHQGTQPGTVVAETVDFGKFLQHGDMSVNLPLQPNDAIYVPVKGSTTNPIAILGGIFGLGTSAKVLTGR